MAPEAPDLALFTKSYAGDFELCRRLCASVDRHMPHVRHYLVVDRVDRALFAPLAGGARVLLTSEDYLPELWRTQLFGRRIWLTPYGPPVRGWIQQQLAKMAVIATLPETAVTLLDSDAVLVRPIPREAVLRGGRTRLYVAPGAGRLPTHLPWHRVAARVLGLPATDYFGADYIITAVTWRPEVVRALLARIAAVTWLPWRMALTWRFRFSECILYGVFAQHAPGPHQDLVFADETNLCHANWDFDLDAEDGRTALVAALRPHHAAVVIQSNLGLPIEVHDSLIARLAARAAGADA